MIYIFICSSKRVPYFGSLYLYLVITFFGGITLTNSLSKSTSGINNWNYNNNNNTITNFSRYNDQKNSSKTPSIADSHSEWSLQFDPNYFATLNAANHKPLNLISGSSTKQNLNTSVSSQNLYYYSPETYGKTTHKNHQTGSYSYTYPSTSTTTTTSTSTISTPKLSSDRFAEYSADISSNNDYNEAAPETYNTQYNPSNSENDKQSDVNYNYEDESDDEESGDYDKREETARKYIYPLRNKNKKVPLHSYYGSDLTSLPSHDSLKSQTSINSPIVDYSPEDSQGYYEPIDDLNKYSGGYGSTSAVKFPSKYYGAGTGAYYPSYYPSHYYPSTHSHSYSDNDSLSSSKSSSWIGPGIAGLLLGILPLGMLIASMVPFVGMPIVSTAAVGRKKRHTQYFNLFDNYTQLLAPILNTIDKFDSKSMDNMDCLKEIFCTISAEGKNQSTHVLQRLLYKIINWMPKELANMMGMSTIFTAVKLDKCNATFKCGKSSAKI